MAGYTKLFSSIVTSTIWCEDNATLRVWIAMLAMADASGHVGGAVPGFANLARVTVEEMRRALEILTSPDPDSRTPDNEGRRIEAVPGGWRILNYSAYRESRDQEARREQNREAQRRHRSAMSANVSQESAQAEAEAEAVPPDSPKPGESSPMASAKRKVFVKPTPQEAQEYAASIGFKLDGEKFVAYYEARGWMLGPRRPVVNWKACVVTWKKLDAERASGGGQNGRQGPAGTAKPVPGKYSHLG